MASPFFDVGDQTLRAEAIDKAVQGIVLDKYKIKPLFMSTSVAADTVKYYRESDEDISASVATIARGAGFPQKNPTWDDLTAVMQKRGLETFIAWEDLVSDNIDVQTRSLVRLSDAVAKSVDAAAFTALSASGAVGNTVAATIVSGESWTSPTRGRPQDAVSRIKRLMRAKNYEADTLLMHPTDAELLETNDDVTTAFSHAGSNILAQGFTGKFDGLNVVVSNAL